MPENADPPPDAHGQARRCFEIIGAALAEAGASFSDVVRTRMYLADAADFEAALRAHGEIFGEIRPASTGVVVVAFVDPRYLIEIEAEAVVGPA
jgi:enamine deaminase RidA (YjgF/YER057c/UK114 family)